jgi:tellurite resistance protein TerC
MIYVFGAILIWTGVKLAFEKDNKVEPEKNIFVKAFRRFFPLTQDYHEGKFFVRLSGVLYATPLIVILLVVESTDIVFAVDSIPAILAISRDPFIVYTSNVFAILGLRALYFALAQLMKLFHHLHYGLSLILVLIGIKMIITHFIHIPTAITLGAIVIVLTVSMVASIIWPQKNRGSRRTFLILQVERCKKTAPLKFQRGGFFCVLKISPGAVLRSRTVPGGKVRLWLPWGFPASESASCKKISTQRSAL